MTLTEIFKCFLDVIEFELVFHGEEGWGLIDLQGANLGDIESDRFQTAAQIIDRLDAYINDYYLSDLEEEMLAIKQTFECEIPKTAEEWVEYAKNSTKNAEAEKFVADHKHEFDVLDMIVNHADEVKLDEITACNE